MAASNRAALISKLHKELKKQFKLPPEPPSRPLMETVLYACLLEDAPQEAAEEGLAKLEQGYFDWNEVRVTTASELAEQLQMLPYPKEAATRLKKNLHALFETYYSFDIDDLKKQNLGTAMKTLEQLPAMTPFVLGYVTQYGLGGHAIPVDKSAMQVLNACDIVSESEKESGRVPGLERAIPKAKGREFGALLHQAGIAHQKNNSDPAVKKVILAVNPQAGKSTAASTKKATKSTTTKSSKKTTSAASPPAKKASQKKSNGPQSTSKKASSKSRPTGASKKKSAGKKTSGAKSSSKKLSKKKPR